jgi:CubicO group peptidase (beta-lactamase class C family)
VIPGAFPPLEPDEYPLCAYGKSGCTREIFLKHLKTRGQVYLPNTTPAYSNVAFATLGLVLESMTGASFADNLRKLLDDPLNLNGTSATAPSDASRVIFSSGSIFDWNTTMDGAGIGMGAMFSSVNDLASISRAMLSSSLLPTNTTRAWMKPTSHTSSLTGAVGRPWEIFRATLGPAENNRVVDLYTKGGNGFGYGSNLVLIPDFDVGFSVLLSGELGGVPVTISAIIVDQLLPALEEAARMEADAAFAGTYSAPDGLNSSLKLSTATGVPGLTIEQWISNGSEILPNIYGSHEAQLYPTNIMSNGTKSSWRSSYVPMDDLGAFSACGSWFTPDRPSYGVYSVDKFEFHVDESGKATTVELEAFKVTLHRE